MQIALAALMVVLATSFSYSGTIDPSVPDSRHVEYGRQFIHVAKIKGICNCKKRDGEHDFHASAVIISPHWAVTAAHVVSSADDVAIVAGGKEYKISKVEIHKDFDKDKVGNNDIALCYSEENFGMDFYPELYVRDDEAGKIATICGYGTTGTFSTGAVKSDDLKRAGSNVIERTERKCLVCNNLGGRRTELEFMIASGDSGGGLFIDGKLAGVNSFVMADDGKPNSDYGDECAHTRVSLYADWIKETMEKD
jgi:secreted trypsin-like serine protease